MATMFDRLLLFILSGVSAALSVVLLSMTFGWIEYGYAVKYADNLYNLPAVTYTLMGSGALLLLISIRLFYISARRTRSGGSSIDRLTELGEVRISYGTIQNLALKAATTTRGISEIKSRIRSGPSGLDIELRAAVDGEISIPQVTEQTQRAVKHHIEEMTGLPVANVSVFVSHVAEASRALTFKSRVE